MQVNSSQGIRLSLVSGDWTLKLLMVRDDTQQKLIVKIKEEMDAAVGRPRGMCTNACITQALNQVHEGVEMID